MEYNFFPQIGDKRAGFRMIRAHYIYCALYFYYYYVSSTSDHQALIGSERLGTPAIRVLKGWLPSQSQKWERWKWILTTPLPFIYPISSHCLDGINSVFLTSLLFVPYPFFFFQISSDSFHFIPGPLQYILNFLLPDSIHLCLLNFSKALLQLCHFVA